MKYFSSSLIALAFAATAVQAPAQDASQAPPPQDSAAPAQPDTAPPPGTPAPDADAPPAASAATPDTSAGAQSSTQVSDQEVDQFAQATVKVQAINADTSLDDTAKQTQMADAVKATGLDAARYNEIGQAIATDSALRERVQTAMAKYAGPSRG